MREFVEVSRKWRERKTLIRVYAQEENPDRKIISVSMDLNDFRDAVKTELGPVTWVFTESEKDKRIDAAFQSVLKEMGRQTIAYANHLPNDLE